MSRTAAVQDREKRCRLRASSRGIFGKLTVRDNIVLGGVLNKKGIEEIGDDVLDYFPVLRERMEQKRGRSPGEQQMLSSPGR